MRRTALLWPTPLRRSGRNAAAVLVAALSATSPACGASDLTPPGPTTPTSMAAALTDQQLFQIVTQSDPFARYRVFPNVDEFATGRLNGSEAHRPVIRVSVNATAATVLQNGRLGPGARFPDGSIVFKEIKPDTAAAATVYAVMRKDDGSARSGQGWQWAEFSPTGAVVYSINNRGGACISCHQRESGPQNDLVRTFERQP